MIESEVGSINALNNIGNRWRLHPGAWYRNMEVYLRRFKEFLEVDLLSFTKMRGSATQRDFKRLQLVFCVLALILFMDVAAASTNNGPNSIKGRSFLHSVDEFSNHEVIQPKIYHGIHKIALNNTLNSESRLHESHITLSYYYKGERVIADLHLNEHLIPERHFVRYQDPQRAGEHIVQNFTKIDVDLCHYQGIIRGKPNSRVAVSTCNGGVNGMVRDDDHTYFIHSDEEGHIHDDHFLFRHADLVANATCGYNSESNHIHETNETPKEWDSVQNRIDGSEFNRILRYKRSSTDNIIRGPFNANKHSSFVELVIVVDNKVYKFLGESMKKVHKHCKDLANIVNALYEPLNIFIALVGVVVWNESNEIEFSEDGDKTLKNFLYYRRTKLATNHPNDNAQLLTKEPFNGGVVGKALKGPICTYEFSGGVAMEHSQIVAVVAATMAHEMGHNFGMEHDTPECRCPEEKCIMSASSTSVVPHFWSDCSIDQLNVAFSRGMNYCLRNKPTKLFDSPQCGNGFVEPGEQCDCGLPQYCKNSCCDPYTCMLRSNASCATGECCDFNKCLPKPAGTNCRQAENECDLPEFCTGASEYCPSNVFKRDTESCDNGNAYCYQGNCRSRNNQCRILWGPSGQSSEHCYWKNLNGSRHGNCGFDRINNKYEQCKRDDVMCGMLHCKHLNERLEFGMESVAVLSHSFLNHEGSIIPCRTAIVDLGLETTDPGLTPSGAKCGDDKMCVDRKCRSIESLRMSGIGKECPNNCNGHGQCNSKGNCHCDENFAPPFCEKPGSGGSIDSGPAKDLSGQHIFTTLLFIVFLGIVPFMVIMLFAIRYRDQLCVKRKLFGNIMKSTTKGPAPRPPPSTPNGGLPKSTPSSTDDMNSALLKSPSDSDASTMNNGMFGKFKGFTLKPLSDSAAPTPVAGKNVAYVQPVSKTAASVTESEGVPARAAPPVPKHATLGYDAPKPNASFENAKKASTLGRFSDGAAPALPPPNPGSHPRPIISNPVLEASTCREIGTPSKSGEITPSRPAPTAPPQWSAVPPVPPVPLHTDPKLNTRTKDQGTIKRIASFLKKEDKHPPKVKAIIDKEKLKNIEISAPIPQVDTSNSDSEQQDETKNLVKRAQSMRSPTKKQTAVQTFGSMRNPTGVSRPKSVIGSARPKSPPPRPPGPGGAIRKTPSTTSSGYQLPLAGIADHTYDDCEAVELPLSDIKESPSPSNSDNIYSVIDEAPSISPATQDNMGLLGEIVNEIEKRNVDSIYSASTMKSSSSTDNVKPISPYEDVPELDVPPEPEYIKSSSSTASGGYIRPPAVNAPVARVAPTRSESSAPNAFSSFKPKMENATSNTPGGRGGKSATPPVSAKPSTVAARAKSFNKSPSPLTKTATSSQPSGSEMNTTGEVVAKKPLPSGAAKPKPLTKPSVTSAGAKPTINRTISANKKPIGSTSMSSTTAKPVQNGSVRPLAGKSSTVASLQQKFENSAKGKPPITG